MTHRRALLPMLLASCLLAGLGCHPMDCETDDDCFGGWECVGSSLCPDDVVCVWEGEPGVCLPPDEDGFLCHVTSGRWDPDACGHYRCGEAPACTAVIPGCDCGPSATYVDGEGCVRDPACKGEDGCVIDDDCPEDLVCHGATACPPWMDCVWEGELGICVEPDHALCADTGGHWDEGACGDYACGEPRLCRALIPGCDCGSDANFWEGEGCVRDEACGPITCHADDPCRDGGVCLHVCPANACEIQDAAETRATESNSALQQPPIGCDPLPCIGICQSIDAEPQDPIYFR